MHSHQLNTQQYGQSLDVWVQAERYSTGCGCYPIAWHTWLNWALTLYEGCLGQRQLVHSQQKTRICSWMSPNIGYGMVLVPKRRPAPGQGHDHCELMLQLSIHFRWTCMRPAKCSRWENVGEAEWEWAKQGCKFLVLDNNKDQSVFKTSSLDNIVHQQNLVTLRRPLQYCAVDIAS
jgi:hypothetical protein